MNVETISLDRAYCGQMREQPLIEALGRAFDESTGSTGFETRALHVTGPAGGGGGSDPVVREVLAVQSLLIPRELVTPEVYVEGGA